MKRIETQIDLPAEPSVVWAHLTDMDTMGTWNPFITSMSGVLKVGERLQVRIAPVGGRPMTFKPRVTIVEPGQCLEWLGTHGRTWTLRGQTLVHADTHRPRAHPFRSG